jgi:hypothetical protein
VHETGLESGPAGSLSELLNPHKTGKSLQKFINDTDERIVSITMELGTGVGDDFVPLTFEDDGVAFEMRTLVPREFFEGSTGAPDRMVWNPQRFAHMSPKAFDDGLRPRFDPGFFDEQAAGLFPPQNIEGPEKSQFIDSGLNFADGRVGAITLNHFNMTTQQAAGAGLPGNPFGYLMPESIAPTVIERHDDGDPESEGDDFVAWWDGYDWRWGVAGDPDLEDDPFGVVPVSQLEQWAAKLLGQNIPGADPDRYESLVSDDLSALNMDTYIYIGEEIVDEATGEPKYASITLRLTAHSATALGMDGFPGTEEPEWMLPGNEAPPLESYMPATGVPVAINDIAVTMVNEAVDIDVLANDLLDGNLVDPDPGVSTLNVVSGPDHGSTSITAGNTIEYTPDADFTGDDFFHYTVTIGGETSNEATVKITVNPEPVPDAPVANNDWVETFRDIPVTIHVLDNDTVSGGPIPEGATITVVDGPLNGSAQVEDDVIEYTPNEGFLGFERFTYRVTVDGVESNLALVTVEVVEWFEDFDLIFRDRFETPTSE